MLASVLLSVTLLGTDLLVRRLLYRPVLSADDDIVLMCL